MTRIFVLLLLLIISVLITSNALAGFGSYSSPYSSDTVAAPVQIKDKGVYNLIISIQFLNEPYEQKPYKTDAYENLIRRLKVEWSGVALLQVLSAKEQTINDLVGLKANIEKEILKLSDQLKSKYSFDKSVEVVFSIANFYLLEPKNN